ncbi:metal ABC transporter permease [Thalassobius sp. I31.1]|uniref:metal ABC transporter permease n=1 Tax=Thalassobius sp. I31.1 TaxID=2109912 RepID=UPI000D1B6F95|nr:metal ABC transporter permease [Thalassobius sp. I31.1]
MLDDFIIRAALAALGTGIAAGLLGCFVVWRRLAYFGDAIAHAAILGVALALALGTSALTGVLGISLIMALLLSTLAGRQLGHDSILGVLAHTALALGLVIVSLLQGIRIDLSAWLFGEILAVGKSDLALIWSGTVLIAVLLIWRWQKLLTATLSPDLAYASNINPKREELILTLALALVVAVAIKVVGALLIGALLIIPASAARPWARTPEAMAAMAAGIGALSGVGGIYISAQTNTPAGPTIICVAAGIFLITLLTRNLTRLKTP